MSKKLLRSLALYLPQFHPIPENDIWWGKGFTEWTNVVKGKQVVKGQYQPHLPSDLGFYDLRLPEIREAQAKMAKDAGIHGFVYYHYWFNGKRLLERPFNEVLKSGKPDFPFCLCWANENWTKAWNGQDKDVLIKQDYSHEDDLNHIQYLCKNVFGDKRYIKVDGKPLFIVYKPSLLPDMKKTVEIWRDEVKKHGYKDIYLVFFWSYGLYQNPVDFGFDAAALFPPNSLKIKPAIPKIIKKLDSGVRKVTGRRLYFLKAIKYNVFLYDELVKEALSFLNYKKHILYPGITPGWDNFVRRPDGGGKTYVFSTPEKYKIWLKKIFDNWEKPSDEENFIFINAWNEWAEGNHLEPCQKWGTQYLDATKEVLNNKL